MDKSKKLVEHLAKLSRLDIGAKEHQQMDEQMPQIIDYVAQLQKIEVTNVPPPLPPTENLRTDEVSPADNRAAILEQAPDKSDQWWKVNGVFN